MEEIGAAIGGKMKNLKRAFFQNFWHFLRRQSMRILTQSTNLKIHQRTTLAQVEGFLLRLS